MPFYDLTCGHVVRISFDRFDALKELDWPKSTCDQGCVDSRPISAPPVTFYGAWRINDPVFRDAEEASGEKVHSTKDIDKMEKAGKMYRITNPSQYKTNDRKIKV